MKRSLFLTLLFSLLGTLSFAQIPGLEVGGSLSFSHNRLIPQGNEVQKASTLELAPWVSMDLSDRVFAGTTLLWTRYKTEGLLQGNMVGLAPFVGLSIEIAPRISFIPDVYVGSTWGKLDGNQAHCFDVGLEFGILRFNLNEHWSVSSNFGTLSYSITRVKGREKVIDGDFYLFRSQSLSLVFTF